MKNRKNKVRGSKKKQEKSGFTASKRDIQEMVRHLSILNIRLDSALMGVAALVLHLVDTKQLTWGQYKENETAMSESLKFIRDLQRTALSKLGEKALPDDVKNFMYEEAVKKGMDTEVLEHIFGVKEGESKIIKPNRGIITPK